MRRWIASVLVIGAIGLVTAFGAVATGLWAPWAWRYVEGVDVSWHQGPIDWRALAGSSVRFAYIKATEGGDYTDPRFEENWRAAGEAHLLRGAYHFFTLCRPGRVQADHFNRTVPREANTLPPALDLEHIGPCREGPTMTNVPSEVRAYLDRVQRYYGVRPILYVTREFHDAHLAELRGERFWVRNLYAPPHWRERDWVIWQHQNRGRRPGVSGPVDLNAFRGDDAALARFASAREPTI